MKNSKVMAALVILGLAAAATPVMALENQFSGSFAAYYDLSNYSATGNAGDPASVKKNSEGLSKDAPTQNYFVQRARLGYTAKVSEDVKLVSKFELDYSYWGNSSYTTKRNSGGAIGADSVNLETKNLYVDFNVVKGLNAKIGMQGYSDSFKGVMFDADMAGILLAHEYDNASVTAGFFRFSDRKASTIGKNTNDMFVLDGKYNISKASKIGVAYYYIGDNQTNDSKTTTTPVGPITGYTADGVAIYATAPTITTTTNPANNTKLHTVGLNAETALGPVTLTGFALAQLGDFDATKKAKGYAFNLGAKIPLASGTVRSEFLYVAGGKNEFYVANYYGYSEGGGFYDAEMIMLNRDKNAKTIDSAIVYNTNNYSQGLIFGSLGYDQTFTPKLSGSVNAGFAAVAKPETTMAHKSDYLGTELNVEVNYKLTPAVTLGARAGYVFLGDYFKGNSFDNPYDVKLIASLSF